MSKMQVSMKNLTSAGSTDPTLRKYSASGAGTKFDQISQKMEGRMLFGIPKKGRLHEKVINILKNSGLDFIRLPRLDIAECKRIPITLVFLPAHDIADYVGSGSVDIGITGEDMVAESGVQDKIVTLTKLDFGKCSLCVQAPVGTVKDVKELCGKRIATSFPNVTRTFFKDMCEKKTDVKYVSGSVEVACALGLADAVVDLVETGTTMRAAGLEVVAKIMDTECVLITKKDLSGDSAKLVEKVHQRVEGYQIAQKFSMISYNLPKTKFELAKQITPGREAPTVAVLDDPDWISISALVEIKSVNDIMDALIDLGAKSILIFAVSNCRFPTTGPSVYSKE